MQELYNSICKLLCQLIRSYEEAMVICQSMQYEGRKRVYQTKAIDFKKYKVCLMKELYDKYRVTATAHHETIPYTARGYKDHLIKWDAYLKEHIDNLVELNKQYVAHTGFKNCIVEHVLCDLLTDYQKTGRDIKRFTEGGWNSIEMHSVDHEYHEKEKMVHEKKGY